MTDLAPHLTAFLREHLPRDQGVSRHTIASYGFSFQLLIAFASRTFSTRPSRLTIEHLTPDIILDFLDSLEKDRKNTVRTRNLRLVAIKSFFHYLEFRVPTCLELAQQVHAIPMKRFEQGLVDYLDRDQMQAVLDAPDVRTTNGIRDRAMLHLTYAAGLRVSELIGLKCCDLKDNLQAVHVLGKGRRERILPLWKTTQTVLMEWLGVRSDSRTDFLFLNARGLPMSRHGFAHRLNLHVATARRKIPSLAGKRVSPHVIRHSCAIHTLEATQDIRKVSMWLGHASLQTTEIYLRVDAIEKLGILSVNVPPQVKRGNFKHRPDQLMAMLGDVKKL